jgi:hypothetical protein
LFILPTQWLKIERVRHPIGLNKKVLQISDFHVERLRISQEKLRHIIQREDPDFIFLTGDFTKKAKQMPRLKKYLEVFQGSGRPTYAVLGNHDYKQPSVGNLVKQIERYGIQVLRNESVRLDEFTLIGIDDFVSGHSDVDQSFRNVDSDLPNVVITHDPNVVLTINRRFDYLMAGHFHGKQFNIPFLFKLKPMGPLPAMGIYKGLHHNAYGTYYISKGIGQTGFNFRFLIRSEITVHHV